MPKPTYRIGAQDGILSMISKMAAGNHGAEGVLRRFINLGVDGLQYLLDLDDMGMSGTAIWLGFNDHCGKDFEKFKECLGARDTEMVKTIVGKGEYAVRCGDSDRR